MNDLSQTLPLVSIIMPVFNGSRLINASIKSVINQTYTNWECIIVNDGSSDVSHDFFDKLALVDSRIKVIHHHKNQGRARARQTALEATTGKYIAMLDAEDMWHPDKLASQVKILEENIDIALVSSSIISFGTHTDILRWRGVERDEIVNFNGRNIPLHASSMLRREIAYGFRYDSTWELGEDANFLKRYLEGRKFARQSSALYYYSEFDSVTKSKIRKNYIRIFKEYIASQHFNKTLAAVGKIIYSYLVFPFIPTENIIKKRGRIPHESDIEFFNDNIRPLVNACNTVSELPTYSVAIRTLGKSGDMFRRELLSIAAQTVTPENIFVYLADGYEKHEFTLGTEKYITVPKGMVSQRVLPYDEITSEYILFLDDDVELSPSSAEIMLKDAKNNNADCICADTFHNHLMNWPKRLYNIFVNLTFPFHSKRWGMKIGLDGAMRYNGSPHPGCYETQAGEGPAWMVRKEAWLKCDMDSERWMDNMSFAYAEDFLQVYKLHSNGFRCFMHYGTGITHLDAATSSGHYKSTPKRFLDRSKMIFIDWHRMQMCNPTDSVPRRFTKMMAFAVRALTIFPAYLLAAVKSRRPIIAAYHIQGLWQGWRFINSKMYKNLPPYVLPHNIQNKK